MKITIDASKIRMKESDEVLIDANGGRSDSYILCYGKMKKVVYISSAAIYVSSNKEELRRHTIEKSAKELIMDVVYERLRSYSVKAVPGKRKRGKM